MAFEISRMHHHAIPTHLSPDVHSDDLQIPVTHVMMRGVQLESWLLDIWWLYDMDTASTAVRTIIQEGDT
jgi:hypothetical protein